MPDPDSDHAAPKLPARLIVDIGPAEPVSGQIGTSPEDMTSFEGWAELAAAIERQRRAAEETCR